VAVHQSRGRPDQGKTKTIKARSVYLYAPTEDMLASWKKDAESHDMSLSRFLVEVIDDALRHNPDGISLRKETEAHLDRAIKDLAAERKEKESLQMLLAQAERSMAAYRDAMYDVIELSGDEVLLRRLIELFHERNVWKIEQIPRALKLSPLNAEDMKKLKIALDRLKELGVVDGDFESVRCRIGARKKIPKSKHRVRAARFGKRPAGIPRGLRPADDDDRFGKIVPVDAP